MADETKQNPEETTPQAEAASTLPENKVAIETTGDAGRKITIEIDRQRVDAKYNEIFGELRNSALVPGFRIGHAPRRLMEKRFGKEVGQDVRNALVSEALSAAIKANKIQILGDPDIELDKIEVPETGNMTFSVQVEVKPEFTVPEYKGIAVQEMTVEITPERVEQATRQFLSSRGTLVPVTGPAGEDDVVVADISHSGEGIEAHSHENVEVRVGPGVLEGVPLEKLGDALKGAKAGDTVTTEATVPDTHSNEAWRGKTISFSIAVKDVKHLEVPELTDQLAGEFGFESTEPFKNYVHDRLQEQVQRESRQAMHDQVAKYLLDNTKVELPTGAATRHTASALRRRYIDLLYRGVPREQIDQNLEMLQAQVSQQAQVELKLSFILEKIAEAENVTVEEGEVNSRIAMMASQYGRRPERLRTEMTNEGTLGQVEVQIREQKTIEKLIDMANVTKAEVAK